MIDDTKSKLAQALRLIADALETDDPPPVATQPIDRLLTADEIAKVRPVTRGWLKRNATPRGKGSRQRPLYDLAEVDNAIKADPPQPRPKVVQVRRAPDQDPFDALLASGAVVAKGRRI